MCHHPEYLEPLRDELQSSEYDAFVETTQGLPLLDSFVKESARMYPVDSSKLCSLATAFDCEANLWKVTSRRAALIPFSLSDGTKVHPGDWICVPMQAMSLDPEFYPNPDSFNAFRFVDPKRLQKGPPPQSEGDSKFTDVSYTWGMWGNVRTAWYVPSSHHSPVTISATVKFMGQLLTRPLTALQGSTLL